MPSPMAEEPDVSPAGELVSFGAPPPYATADPAAATAAVEAAAKAAVGLAEELGGGRGGTWEDVVAPLDEADERMEREYSMVAHMHAVCASPEWDEANRKSIAALVGASTAIGQNRGLYERYVAVREAGGLSAGRARILSDMIAGFELSGVALDGEKRERFAANEMRVSQLGSQFEENVREATAAWSEDVSDEASLGDMPADMKDAARTDGGWRFWTPRTSPTRRTGRTARCGGA